MERRGTQHLERHRQPHPWIEAFRDSIEAIAQVFSDDQALRDELYANPDPRKRRLRVSCNDCQKPWCCKHPVYLTLLEGMALYAYGAEHAPKQLERAIERGAELRRRKPMDDGEFFHRNFWCPFLVENRCRAYAVRPHACRTHYSKGNPNRCKPELQPVTTYGMDPDPKLPRELARLDDDARFFGLIGEVEATELSQMMYLIELLRDQPLPAKNAKKPLDLRFADLQA